MRMDKRDDDDRYDVVTPVLREDEPRGLDGWPWWVHVPLWILVAGSLVTLIAWGVAHDRHESYERRERQITTCQQGGGAVKIDARNDFESCLYPPVRAS